MQPVSLKTFINRKYFVTKLLPSFWFVAFPTLSGKANQILKPLRHVNRSSVLREIVAQTDAEIPFHNIRCIRACLFIFYQMFNSWVTLCTVADIFSGISNALRVQGGVNSYKVFKILVTRLKHLKHVLNISNVFRIFAARLKH